MLDLGFRTHDFGKFGSAEALADTVSALRKNACLHFAPYKALDNVPKPLNTEWAVSVRRTFASKGIRVAILGCYINPVHPDPDKLEEGLQAFENGIHVAKALGNPLVATETGSLDVKNIRCNDTWSGKNWTRFLNIMERLLKCAADNDVTMAIEAVADKNTVDTPERMFSVMETFKSPNLRCLFDAVNIMPVKGVSDFYGYYDEAVSMLSPYISAMHLKDFVWADSNPNYPFAKGPVKNGAIPIGEGLMPWKTIFGIYKKYKVDNVPMTLENFKPETAARSLTFIEDSFKALT
ncbi:MAG: sugar phosphate isomerase/epimerase family protein [Sphaerochaeta sp.]